MTDQLSERERIILKQAQNICQPFGILPDQLTKAADGTGFDLIIGAVKPAQFSDVEWEKTVQLVVDKLMNIDGIAHIYREIAERACSTIKRSL